MDATQYLIIHNEIIYRKKSQPVCQVYSVLNCETCQSGP